MKKLAATICLTVALLFGSTASSSSEGTWAAIENQPNCSVWTINKNKGLTARWSGTCLNGKATGQGTLIWKYKLPDRQVWNKKEKKFIPIKGQWVKDRFEGKIENGKYNGQGRYSYGQAYNIYIGSWKNGLRHGRGTHTERRNKNTLGQRHEKGMWKESITDGEWKEGVYQGAWVVLDNHSNCSLWVSSRRKPDIGPTATWSGLCLKGRPDGRGTLTLKGRGGSFWLRKEGQWKKTKDGEWVKEEFIGTIKNGDFNGLGTLIEKRPGMTEKYIGEWQDGKRHGQGFDMSVLKSVEEGGKKTGDWITTYVGSFKNNQQHGLGTWIDQVGGGDHIQYTGYWKDGKYEGIGFEETIQPEDTDAKGETKMGYWKGGDFLKGSVHHQGRYRTGETYVGEYKGYYQHGRGTLTTRKGLYYSGGWNNGLRHGQGTLAFSKPHKRAGEKYVGEFRAGKFEGKGTQTFSAPHSAAGLKYIGEFRDGKFDGKGTLAFSKPHKSAGEKYVGDFLSGRRLGQGTQTFSAPHSAAGFKYVGEFIGNKNGNGTATFVSRSTLEKWRYIGEWKNALQDGQGTFIAGNGEKYVGKWEKGAFHGLGTFTSADGTTKKGLFKRGKFQKMAPSVTPKELTFEEAKNKCSKIGFKEGNENFAQCVMKLLN